MKKIIITESQYNRLFESDDDTPKWLKRRLNSFEEEMGKLLGENDPNEFGDEFEFADNILSWAVSYSGLDSSPQYDDDTYEFLKERYGEMLFDIYGSMVSPDDEDIYF